MYVVELTVRVERFLEKLDATIKTRIEKRLKRLGDDPVPSDAKCIGRQDGKNIFRYRIGGFRVLYTVNSTVLDLSLIYVQRRQTVALFPVVEAGEFVADEALLSFADDPPGSTASAVAF